MAFDRNRFPIDCSSPFLGVKWVKPLALLFSSWQRISRTRQQDDRLTWTEGRRFTLSEPIFLWSTYLCFNNTLSAYTSHVDLMSIFFTIEDISNYSYSLLIEIDTHNPFVNTPQSIQVFKIHHGKKYRRIRKVKEVWHASIDGPNIDYSCSKQLKLVSLWTVQFQQKLYLVFEQTYGIKSLFMHIYAYGSVACIYRFCRIEPQGLARTFNFRGQPKKLLDHWMFARSFNFKDQKECT